MYWISVNEKTPNLNECILIAYEDKNGFSYCCVGLYDSSGFNGDEHSRNPHFEYKATYWIYVPDYPVRIKIQVKEELEEKQIFTFKRKS